MATVALGVRRMPTSDLNRSSAPALAATFTFMSCRAKPSRPCCLPITARISFESSGLIRVPASSLDRISTISLAVLRPMP